VASAKTPTGTGTITCTTFTATITFKPALVPGTATSPKDTEKSSGSVISSCSTSPSGGPTSASKVKEKPTKFSSNACSQLEASSTGASFTISWPGLKPSKVTFSGATNTSTGYKLTDGTVTGSYPTSGGASATINIAPASETAASNCVEGKGGSLSSLTISGGSMTL